MCIRDRYKEFAKMTVEKVSKCERIEVTIVKNIKEVLKNVENYIMSNVYSLVFPREPSESDEKFSDKLLSLQSAKIPELLQKDNIPEDLVSIAMAKFKHLPLLKSPHKKIENCVQVCTILREGLEMKTKESGAVPYGGSQLLVFVVLNSNLPRLISEINYIDWFKMEVKSEAKNCLEQAYDDVKFSISFLNKLKSVPT
eukprot:TRINITY_DN16728_c0_g2_i1.p1 TRINITY_DN16728_c0_g2~~TRINITY_DN16728_c0_g2_i1.p1  ORF type:complete len:198 (+),score=54.01 TRINITY_DN16728_c0_g2_i1:73-666(+)